MFGSLLWWPILSTIITILYMIFEPDIGFDFLTIFGSSAISYSLGVVIIWSLTILSLWISAVSFVYGWDAVSDFARWNRRVKANSEIESDLIKLKELLN